MGLFLYFEFEFLKFDSIQKYFWLTILSYNYFKLFNFERVIIK